MSSDGSEVRYRLAPLVVARLVGLCLVVVALLLFVGTALVTLAGLPADLLVIIVAVLLIGILAGAWWLRSRAWVLRCTPSGYQVRMVRGAGTKQARWDQVEDAVEVTRREVACAVLRLRDGRTTTIPFGVLAVGREQFLGELRGLLQQGQRLRPL